MWDATEGRERLTLEGGAAWVEHIAWSPRGHLLGSAAGRRLRLWDAQGRLMREHADHASTIAAIGWKPGGQEIAAAAYGGIAFWTPDSPEPARRLAWKGSILTLAWSPDGRSIAAGDQDATVHFWMVRSGKELEMCGYATKVRELSWEPSSRYLATGGGPVAIVWDCAGKGPENTRPIMLERHQGLLTVLAYQHAGTLLASGGEDGRVVLWHPGRGSRPLAEVGLTGSITRVAWSPDDRSLAVGDETGAVELFRVSP